MSCSTKLAKQQTDPHHIKTLHEIEGPRDFPTDEQWPQMRAAECDRRRGNRSFSGDLLIFKPTKRHLPKEQFLHPSHSHDTRQEYHNVVRRDDVIGSLDF